MTSSHFTSRLSAAVASLLLLSSLPAVADNSRQSLEEAVGKERPIKIAHVAPVTTSPDLAVADVIKPDAAATELEIAPDAKPILVAQAASCTTCGTALDPLILMESGGKKKDKSLLTDSLWGNLILEMAYQRDARLKKLAKRMNLVNFGTMASIGTIAGGTLAQGIIALQTLNPPEGHLDSYTPGIIGTTLSTATIMTFVARMYFNHKMQKDVQDQQMAIKSKVEGVLDHLERSESKCADAQKDLSGLIGERACHEWIQLWQSSHKLALAQPPRITLGAPKVAPPKSAISYDVDTVVSGEFWE